MGFLSLNNVVEKEIVPGYRARFIHSENMTLAYWEVDAGAALPEHSHPHEQIANVLEGHFELTVDGDRRVLEPGTVAIIPSHVPHSGKAITACRLLDAFYPCRDDYR
ncbi:MAG: cupin domain-containing protein [Anaerolineales bacterium]|nr:MAG: cupin domain-containing protein [Anaerolineales bacterium]